MLPAVKTHKISTHTPAWGVTNGLEVVRRKLGISTHTPAWGVTYHVLLLVDEDYFNFNSHARVGRDKKQADELALVYISTHTPAWGVTEGRQRRGQPRPISTHTPAWGVTQSFFNFKRALNHFNSHARVGRD